MTKSKNFFVNADLDVLKNAVNAIMPVASSDFQLLAKILTTTAVKRYDNLLKEGEVCRNIFFLSKGFFRMYYVDVEGNEINYRFTEKYDFFVNFQSFLTQKPSRYYWQAMQHAEIFVMNYNDVYHLYNISSFWNNFGKLMAEKVYLQLNERVDMLLLIKPEERYQYLLDTRPELFS